jgi:glycine/D-amino acid oxidase-like deaminating enzyme
VTAPRVVVIGGGIVGMSAAALLAADGVSVTVVEREAVAAGASGRNSGVVQQPFDAPLIPLYQRSLALYRELDAGRTGPQRLLADDPAGLLLVSHHAPVVEALAGHLRATLPELRCEVLGGDDPRRVEPGLAAGVAAVRLPVGYPVVPAAPTYAWATRAERLGVTIRLGRAALPARRGDRVVGVDLDGRTEPADAVLVAAGPWSPALVDPSGDWRPIRPNWGVVVETVMADPPRHVIEEAAMDVALGTGELAAAASAAGELAAGPAAAKDEVVVEPAERPETSFVSAGGVTAVGSTFLDAEPRPADWTEPILARAATFVPAVVDAPIRETRACARPLSADGRPLIGAVPWLDGLFVCAGHGPWGITTGPASARLVADLILGRLAVAATAAVIDQAFDPGRFGTP